MPSKSKNQQIAAAIALKAKEEGKSPEAGTASAQMAKMPKKSLKKFAKTKHTGLPQRVPKKKAKKTNEAFGQKLDMYVDIIYRWLDKQGYSESEIDDILNDPTSIEIISNAESHGINPILAIKEINIREILTESLNEHAQEPISAIFFNEYLPNKGFFDARFTDTIEIDPRKDRDAEEKILIDFSKYLEEEHYEIWDPALEPTLYKQIVHKFFTEFDKEPIHEGHNHRGPLPVAQKIKGKWELESFPGLPEAAVDFHPFEILNTKRDPGYGYDHVVMMFIKFTGGIPKKYQTTENTYGLLIWDMDNKQFIEEPGSLEDYGIEPADLPRKTGFEIPGFEETYESYSPVTLDEFLNE
jgi:hypothetical protein